MKLKTKPNLALHLLLGTTLLLASLGPVWSQGGKIALEEKPLAESAISISGNETVRLRMEKFIKEVTVDGESLQAIKNNQKDKTGRTIRIDFATGTIAAPPSDPNFINARILAFGKAMHNAKGQCAVFQGRIVSTEAIADAMQPLAERVKADEEQSKREGLTQEGAAKVAQALNTDFKSKADMPQFMQTAALNGEKLVSMKMAEELRKLGLDPSKPVDQKVAKAVVESELFQKMVAGVAQAHCTGIKVMAAFEQSPKDKQGEVGIVTVWSEKLHAIADAMVTNQWGLYPKGEPGKTIAEHIPKDTRTLLTTYGTQLVRNEKGEYVLLAYSQAQPRTENQQSINLAYRVANLQAFGLIRSFMGEVVVANDSMRGAEVATVFPDSIHYQYDGSAQFRGKAVGEALPISGVTEAFTWETRHPANDGPVVGVVLQWKVESAKIAAHLAKLNQASGFKAQAAAAPGVSGGGGAVAAPTARPAEPRKADAYSGQGKVAKDF